MKQSPTNSQLINPGGKVRRIVTSLREGLPADRSFFSSKKFEEAVEACIAVLAVFAWLAAMTLLP